MQNEKRKSVVILAAGYGSRLKSSLLKVFHKIGNLSLLDHVIKTSTEINADEIITVLNPKYKYFQSEINPNIIKAFQPEPRGSADTVKYALKHLPDTDSGWVYTLYGDIPLVTADSLNAMYDMATGNTAVVVLAFDAGKEQNLSKLEVAEKPGTIKRIIEARDLTPNDKTVNLCNAGLLIRRDVLNSLINKISPSKVTNEFYLTEIVNLVYQAGFDCRYYIAPKEELSGANTRAELATLEKYFQDRMREKIMNNGVSLISPETVFFSYDTEIENDVIIQPYVVFGKNVKIRTGAVVGPFCVVEGTEVRSAQVGPFSRLRPGAEIHDGAKIGNFVEIKNSVVAENSKVNHLSYIGDSNIGTNTNIGAGTITCNYDGLKKYRTQIGDNVFIGSNSALVAPVNIKNGAMVGAGSIITKDVEPNALALARSYQINRENWAVDFRAKRSNTSTTHTQAQTQPTQPIRLNKDLGLRKMAEEFLKNFKTINKK